MKASKWYLLQAAEHSKNYNVNHDNELIVTKILLTICKTTSRQENIIKLFNCDTIIQCFQGQGEKSKSKAMVMYGHKQ